MRTASLLLLVVAGPSVCLAAEPKEPLEFTDLVALQRQLRDLDQFLDNEYIYKDKLDEFAQKLGELDGRQLSLRIGVEKVWGDQVTVALPEVPGGGRSDFFGALKSKLPGIVLVPEGGGEAELPKDRSLELRGSAMVAAPWMRLPGNLDWSRSAASEVRFELPVRKLVSLELAKMLRLHDRLLVRGTVQPLIVTLRGQGRCIMFLIRDPEIERAKAADGAQENEDVR